MAELHGQNLRSKVSVQTAEFDDLKTANSRI